MKFTLPIIGLAVDASALYDQRQGKAKESDQTIKAQSIQIPINVRYGVGLGDLAEIFLFAGPQFGFNVGSDKTLYEQANVAKSTWTLKSSNFSLNVGIGATALKGDYRRRQSQHLDSRSTFDGIMDLKSLFPTH